jgi:hypothetical protein
MNSTGVNIWDVFSALAIGVASGAALVFAVNSHWDVRRDRVIMELQHALIKSNRIEKELRKRVQD